MRRRLQLTAVVAVIAVLGVVAARGGDRRRSQHQRAADRLRGDAGAALHDRATASSRRRSAGSSDEIRYRFRTATLEGGVTQAHIHFGHETRAGRHQRVAVREQPAGHGRSGRHAGLPGAVRQRSPARSGPRTSSGPTGQGIDAGQFDELLDALDAGVTYVNVHTQPYPGGEIRAQLGRRPTTAPRSLVGKGRGVAPARPVRAVATSPSGTRRPRAACRRRRR